MPITRTELITALREIADRLEQHSEIEDLNDIGRVHITLWPQSACYEGVRLALGAGAPRNENGIVCARASFDVVDLNLCGFADVLGTVESRSAVTTVSEWTYKPPQVPA